MGKKPKPYYYKGHYYIKVDGLSLTSREYVRGLRRREKHKKKKKRRRRK